MRNTYVRRNLTGLAVTAIGAGFLLDALGLWNFGRIAGDWWPLALIALGLVGVANTAGSRLVPTIILGAGVLLQLRELDVLDFSLGRLVVPAIITGIGLTMLTGKAQPKTAKESDDTVDLLAAFSGSDVRSTSDDFKGGKVTALFGGVKLDLRDARIRERAVLDVTADFGGVELVVPESWQVRATGTPLFGGWEDKTRKPEGGDAPVLEVRGMAMFGGVEIKN